MESKRIQDRAFVDPGAREAWQGAGAAPAGKVPAVEKLKPVSYQSRHFRGRLHVLVRSVNGMAWRSRFCVLDGATLRAHRQKRDGRLSKPILARDLSGADISAVGRDRMRAPTAFMFQVVARDGHLLLCAPDEAVAFAWMQALRSAATPPPLVEARRHVEPRKRFVLPVRSDVAEDRKMTFSWDFSVEGKDIAFQAYFEQEGEAAQYPVLVTKWQRHSAWVGAVQVCGRALGQTTAR